jgi:hypothetical protein
MKKKTLTVYEDTHRMLKLMCVEEGVTVDELLFALLVKHNENMGYNFNKKVYENDERN